MNPILEANQVVKVFGQGQEKLTALKEVDLQMKEGEFVAIMGSSGSGKSTLLYTLSAIEDLDGGDIKIDGTSLQTLSQDQRADIRREKFGFVFQHPTMLKNLSLLENILLPALYEKQHDKTKILEDARRLMKQTGISHLEERGITEVSGGQLQRAGICRALLHKPRMIFADEPTGALDSKSGEEIMELFKQIHKEGISILLVTHDSKVAAVSERVLFMKDGEIKAQASLGDFSPEERIELIERSMKENL